VIMGPGCARVQGDLAVSRAFGDAHLKRFGVSAARAMSLRSQSSQILRSRRTTPSSSWHPTGCGMSSVSLWHRCDERERSQTSSQGLVRCGIGARFAGQHHSSRDTALTGLTAARGRAEASCFATERQSGKPLRASGVRLWDKELSLCCGARLSQSHSKARRSFFKGGDDESTRCEPI